MGFREMLFVAIGAGMGWLLMFKSDQQSIHVLGGKLERLGKSTEAANESYRRHCNRWPPIFAAVGMAAMFLGVITLTIAGIAVGIVGAILFFAAILLRIRSFQRADDELN